MGYVDVRIGSFWKGIRSDSQRICAFVGSRIVRRSLVVVLDGLPLIQSSARFGCAVVLVVILAVVNVEFESGGKSYVLFQFTPHRYESSICVQEIYSRCVENPKGDVRRHED